MVNRYTYQYNNNFYILEEFESTGFKRHTLLKKTNEIPDNIELPKLKIDLGNYINSMEISKGQPPQEYDFSQLGFSVIYDEITMSGKNNNQASVVYKQLIPNTITMSEHTYHIGKLTRFKSDNNTYQVSSKLDMFNNLTCKVNTYAIGDNTLTETISTEGKLLKAILRTKDTMINYLQLENSKAYIGRKDFGDLGYNKSVLVTKNKTDIETAKRTGYKQYKILLPNSKAFTQHLRMDYLNNAKYLVINDIDTLKVIVNFLHNLPDNHVLSVDVETTGLKFFKYFPEDEKSKLVTISISWKDNQSIILPLRMKNYPNLPLQEAIDLLKPILETKPILAHNGSADVRFLLEDGIELNLIEDTMLLMKMIVPFAYTPEWFDSSVALDDLVSRALGLDMLDLDKYIFKPSGADFDFSILNEDYMISYGCPDTDLCRRLWKNLRSKLPTEREFVYKELVRFSKNLGEQPHYAGVGINVDSIKKARETSLDIMSNIEKLIHKVTHTTPKTMKLHSGSADIKKYFITEKQVPVTDLRVKKETGALSLDKVVLERLAQRKATTPPPEAPLLEDIVDEDGKPVKDLTKENLSQLQYPVAKLLRTYHDYNKNVTGYYDSMLRNIYNGILYPDFRAGALNTWRTPAGIQTLKSSLKYEVIPPNIPNKKFGWVTVDFATEEVRLAANQSEDYDFIRMMQHPESDVHTLVASDLLGKPPNAITKSERGEAKASNFSIIYGAMAYSLGQNIFGVDTLSKEQLDKATAIHRLYCKRRAKMLNPLYQEKDFVTKHGYQINQFKAPMVYPQVIKKKEFLAKAFNPDIKTPILPEIDEVLKEDRMFSLLNACGNFPIQSWASVILMLVYNNLCKRIKDDGHYDDIKIPVLVHDEVGAWFDLDKVHPYYIIVLMMDCMCLDFSYFNKEVAPLYIGIGFGYNWGDAKGDTAELPVRLQAQLYQEYITGQAPSTEEILEEGLFEHFVRRKKEYILSRARRLFSNQIQTKEFEFYTCSYILNQDLYIQKQLNEFWYIYDKTPNGLELNLNTLTKTLGIENPILSKGEDFTYVEKKEDDMVDFFFIDFDIHERVTVCENSVVVDLKGLPREISQSIDEYLRTVSTRTTTNEFSRQVIFKRGEFRDIKDYKLSGIPLNFNAIFTLLLQGKTIKPQPTVKHLDNYPIKYTDNKLILDMDIIAKEYQDKFKSMIELISTYHSPTGNTKVYLSDKYTDVLINLTVTLQQELDNIIRR